MARLLVVMTLVLVLGSRMTPAAAQEDAGSASAPGPFAQLDAVFEAWDRDDSPGMTVAVVRGGRVLYERGFGMANLEQGVPNGPDTIFRIGSVSKQVTALCLGMLALRGEVDLDASVTTLLPELPSWETPPTLRQMIHHTSGIPDYVGLLVEAGHEFSDHTTPQDALDVLAGAGELEFEPGERFSYSNSNYFLMSVVVERVAGMSLRDFAATHVFERLGMDSTHYHDRFDEVVPGRADGHVPAEDGEGWRIANTAWEQVGDGGVFTTVGDLARWNAVYRESPLEGGQELIELVLTRGVLTDGTEIDYAFGIGHAQIRGEPALTHSGGWAGFVATMIHLPERELEVIVLSNCTSVDVGQLSSRLLGMLLAG